MRFLLKKSVLVLFFVFGMYLIACLDPEPPCNCPQVDPFFDIVGMEAQHLQWTGGWADPLDTNEIVSWENYVMNVQFEVDYYADWMQTPEQWSRDLLPTAWGCSCREDGYEGSDEGIESISIVATNAFRNDINAGDIINDLFRVTDSPSGSGARTVDDFVAENAQTITRELIFLRFWQDPNADGPIGADVIARLGNGEEYEYTLDLAYVN